MKTLNFKDKTLGKLNDSDPSMSVAELYLDQDMKVDQINLAIQAAAIRAFEREAPVVAFTLKVKVCEMLLQSFFVMRGDVDDIVASGYLLRKEAKGLKGYQVLLSKFIGDSYDETIFALVGEAIDNLSK